MLNRYDPDDDLHVRNHEWLATRDELDVVTDLADLVATIVETNLSLRDYRQNQIVKKVSSWAAIIAVPAAITGYYGMNVPYPGSGDTWGFILSSVLLVVASFSLYLLFRWRDWL